MIAKTESWEPFRVIRWRPGIRGVRRWADLRTLTRDGQLWFACDDLAEALMISSRAFRARRHDRLEGNTWGTIRTQWQGRGQRLTFISLTALAVVMDQRPHRMDRYFLRWLDEAEDVAV